MFISNFNSCCYISKARNTLQICVVESSTRGSTQQLARKTHSQFCVALGDDTPVKSKHWTNKVSLISFFKFAKPYSLN